jgi:hypothetical protein
MKICCCLGLDKLQMSMLLPLYLDNVQHTMVIVDVQMPMRLRLYRLNQYNHHNYLKCRILITISTFGNSFDKSSRSECAWTFNLKQIFIFNIFFLCQISLILFVHRHSDPMKRNKYQYIYDYKQ